MAEFKLETGEYIELHRLLKTTGLCDSGGSAKMLIAQGCVLVDGQVELRRRCKIRRGQKVEFNSQAIVIA